MPYYAKKKQTILHTSMAERGIIMKNNLKKVLFVVTMVSVLVFIASFGLCDMLLTAGIAQEIVHTICRVSMYIFFICLVVESGLTLMEKH